MIGRGRGGECVMLRESEGRFGSGVEEQRVGVVVFGGEAEGSSVLSAAYELIP
jgi:hypothetical protein